MTERPIPSTIPAEKTDLIVSAMSCFAELMIQMEMEFPVRLDVPRLARAVELACDAEPVLGCRFVSAKIPYWERLACDERRVFLQVDTAEDYGAFRNRSLDPTNDAQIRICLFRAAEADRVIFKLRHEIADAGGVKDIVDLIASLYRKLATEPNYRPPANLEGDRSADQVLRRIPLSARPRIFWNYLREAAGSSFPPRGNAVVVTEPADDTITFVTRSLDAGQVTALVSYGRRYGATINDVMMTAVLRVHAALAGGKKDAPWRLWTTIDNRRYLPAGKTGGVCNLSAVEIVRVSARPRESFAETLSAVTALSRQRKASWFGLNTYIGMFPLLKIMSYPHLTQFMEKTVRTYFEKGIIQAALTNLGPIIPERVDFEGPPAAACLLVPPVIPPLLGMGLSGYQGSLTLSAGVYPSSTQCEIVRQLIAGIVGELPLD
ncbi:MAG: hypothetical protein PHY31_00755 [Smithellaceae bacterium]|nr:hypothetical protein [Smithellaceae bacterium]